MRGMCPWCHKKQASDAHFRCCPYHPAVFTQTKRELDDGNGHIKTIGQYRATRQFGAKDLSLRQKFGSWFGVATFFGLNDSVKNILSEKPRPKPDRSKKIDIRGRSYSIINKMGETSVLSVRLPRSLLERIYSFYDAYSASFETRNRAVVSLIETGLECFIE